MELCMCCGNWASLSNERHKSLAALCVCIGNPHMVAKEWLGSVSLHSVLGNGSVKTFSRQLWCPWLITGNNRKVCWSLFPQSLLGKNSMETFPLQGRLVGGVVLHAGRVVSQESISVCKIWGFHGGDYEECRLLYIKTQFVPHKKHVSATELIRLMLCKIWGFHGGDYEECLLWCDSAWLLTTIITMKRNSQLPRALAVTS
jgi:hypothetical protein